MSENDVRSDMLIAGFALMNKTTCTLRMMIINILNQQNDTDAARYPGYEWIIRGRWMLVARRFAKRKT